MVEGEVGKWMRKKHTNLTHRTSLSSIKYYEAKNMMEVFHIKIYSLVNIQFYG